MFFNKEKFLLISGPCALESEEIAFSVANVLKDVEKNFPDLNVVFKGSFDKANRSSVNKERGIGIKSGLEILAKIKEEFDFPVTTDIHSVEQADLVAKVCDVIQIPAFLCRQTDLLIAAAKTGRIVNVKKGQFLSPEEMKFVTNKLESADASEIWQTERGTTFGYNRLIVDMRAFSIMRTHGHPVIFDATHSVQLPGAGKEETKGERRFVPQLAKAAIAAGAQGLFIETHPSPENAVSDKESQIPLNEFEDIIAQCLDIWRLLSRY